MAIGGGRGIDSAEALSSLTAVEASRSSKFIQNGHNSFEESS